MKTLLRLAFALMLLLPCMHLKASNPKPQLSPKAQDFAKSLGKNERIIREYQMPDGRQIVLFSSGAFEPFSKQSSSGDMRNQLNGFVSFALADLTRGKFAELAVVDTRPMWHGTGIPVQDEQSYKQAIEETLTTSFCKAQDSHIRITAYYGGISTEECLWLSAKDSIISGIGSTSKYREAIAGLSEESTSQGEPTPLVFGYLHGFTLADGLTYYKHSSYDYSSGEPTHEGTGIFLDPSLDGYNGPLPRALMYSTDLKDFENAYDLVNNLEKKLPESLASYRVGPSYRELRGKATKGKALLEEPKLPWKALTWRPLAQRKVRTIKEYLKAGYSKLGE